MLPASYNSIMQNLNAHKTPDLPVMFRLNFSLNQCITRRAVGAGSVAFVIAALLQSSTAWSKVEYDANQLMMQNSEKMAAIVQKKIKKSHDVQSSSTKSDDSDLAVDAEAVEPLREAMRIVLSRPDQDGTRRTLFARLRSELTDLNSFSDVMASLVDEALAAVKETAKSGDSGAEQGTYLTLLQNWMSELKPDVEKSPAFKKCVEKIRDAKIEISPEAKQFLFKSASKMKSPSETATVIVPAPVSKKDDKK